MDALQRERMRSRPSEQILAVGATLGFGARRLRIQTPHVKYHSKSIAASFKLSPFRTLGYTNSQTGTKHRAVYPYLSKGRVLCLLGVMLLGGHLAAVGLQTDHNVHGRASLLSFCLPVLRALRDYSVFPAFTIADRRVI